MPLVEVDRQPPIRFVAFDNGKRNVMSLAAVEALSEAIAWDDEAPVVVLSGRDDGFCAGLDNAALAGTACEREELLAGMGELLLAALTGETRIVSICEGHAVAAGAMLLLVSDIRIGVPGQYKIGFTEPRLGMPLPDLPARLARERIDRRRLHALTALGRIIGPEEAAEVGFLDELAADPADARDRARAAAAELAQLSPTAYHGSLRAMWGEAIPALERSVEAQSRRRERARSAGE